MPLHLWSKKLNNKDTRYKIIKIHNEENDEMMLQRSKRKKQETRSLKKISDSCVEGAPCYTHLDSRPFRITIASVYD